MERIFISSVQKELAAERRALKDYIHGDALLRRFFDVFLFEDLPAADRRADEVYLSEVDRCHIYVGLFGNEYGPPDAEGLSPTEREFDGATAKGKTRLIYVKGNDDKSRHPKMHALIHKAGAQLMRRRFTDISELTSAMGASLVEYLVAKGMIQNRPFEEQTCPGASLADLAADTVAAFVRRAREERQFPLSEGAAVADVMNHLSLVVDGTPTKAAILLFGSNPQRFLPNAEIRCMHFHGTEIIRPVPFYRIFKGNLFEHVDEAVDFVLSKINRSVGTRSASSQAPVSHELPKEVVAEAIVNAVAHRDYGSGAAVQVLVFADRVEVWNPGELPPPLTPERLRQPHSSIARNHRICEALFLAHYIEKFGTGILMMIRESAASGLPEPDFAQRAGEFVTTLWRDWATDEVMNRLKLNGRQRQAVAHVKLHGRITNAEFQAAYAVAKRTASLDLGGLVAAGLFRKVGSTGKGVFYMLAKGAVKGQKGQNPEDTKGQQSGKRGMTARLGKDSKKTQTARRSPIEKLVPNSPRRKRNGKGKK